VREVGRELGVRYVLEGSVRRMAARVRVTCQLIEAATGAHVWAERFDGDSTDIFELQDKITESVAGIIEPNIKACRNCPRQSQADGKSRCPRPLSARVG
jgi:adenylate cyclase